MTSSTVQRCGGHITLLFTVDKSNALMRSQGSRGAGFSIHHGVEVKATLHRIDLGDAWKMSGISPDQPRPVQEPKPPVISVTDMHGEPLQEIGAQPVTYDPAAAFDYAGQRLNEMHRRLIAYLSQGTFYAVPTLAGHLNIKKESVYHYLSGIKQAGYQLEIRSTGNRKGGYVNIYRLAKTG